MLGGLAGALASVLVIAGAVLFSDVGPVGGVLGSLLMIGTGIGFVVGGFLSPITAWTFLRRVPLWRASVETAFAASFAFALSLVLDGGLGLATVCASACGLLAAWRLKRAYRDATASEPAVEAGA